MLGLGRLWGRGRLDHSNWIGIGLLVELVKGEIIERNADLPLSCIVCCALLCLAKTALMRIVTATESGEIVTSLTVSAARSAFSVPEASLEMHQLL